MTTHLTPSEEGPQESHSETSTTPTGNTEDTPAATAPEEASTPGTSEETPVTRSRKPDSNLGRKRSGNTRGQRTFALIVKTHQQENGKVGFRVRDLTKPMHIAADTLRETLKDPGRLSLRSVIALARLLKEDPIQLAADLLAEAELNMPAPAPGEVRPAAKKFKPRPRDQEQETTQATSTETIEPTAATLVADVPSTDASQEEAVADTVATHEDAGEELTAADDSELIGVSKKPKQKRPSPTPPAAALKTKTRTTSKPGAPKSAPSGTNKMGKQSGVVPKGQAPKSTKK